MPAAESSSAWRRFIPLEIAGAPVFDPARTSVFPALGFVESGLDMTTPLDNCVVLGAALAQRCADRGEFVAERAEHAPRVMRTISRINQQFFAQAGLQSWDEGIRCPAFDVEYA